MFWVLLNVYQAFTKSAWFQKWSFYSTDWCCKFFWKQCLCDPQSFSLNLWVLCALLEAQNNVFEETITNGCGLLECLVGRRTHPKFCQPQDMFEEDTLTNYMLISWSNLEHRFFKSLLVLLFLFFWEFWWV